MTRVSTPVLTSGTELDWGAKGGGGHSPQSSSLISLSRWREFIGWQNLKLKTRNAGLIQKVEHRPSPVPPSGC